MYIAIVHKQFRRDLLLAVQGVREQTFKKDASQKFYEFELAHGKDKTMRWYIDNIS